MYVIYALIDPRDNTVRYVGSTEDVYTRFMSHISCSGSNYAKNAWMHELRAVNKMVIMETLEEVATYNVAVARETYWIHHFEMLKEPVMNIRQTSSPRTSKRTNLRIGRRISMDIVTAVVSEPSRPVPTLGSEDRLFTLKQEEDFLSRYEKTKNIRQCLRQMVNNRGGIGLGHRYYKHANWLIAQRAKQASR